MQLLIALAYMFLLILFGFGITVIGLWLINLLADDGGNDSSGIW